MEALRAAQGTPSTQDDASLKAKVTDALANLDGKVATFAKLLIKEEERRGDEQKKDRKPDRDITIDNTQCKP